MYANDDNFIPPNAQHTVPCDFRLIRIWLWFCGGSGHNEAKVSLSSLIVTISCCLLPFECCIAKPLCQEPADTVTHVCPFIRSGISSSPHLYTELQRLDSLKLFRGRFSYVILQMWKVSYQTYRSSCYSFNFQIVFYLFLLTHFM